MTVLIPYAVSQEGALVTAADARSEHRYECPECHSRLSVREGSRRRHFAHRPHHATCRFEGESALHVAAKRAIYYACTTWIDGEAAPPMIYRKCRYCSVERAQALPDMVRAVRMEERIERPGGTMIADVALMDSAGRPMAVVEILHTHRVDVPKEVKLAGLPWIELKATDVLADALNWRPVQTRGLKQLPCLCSRGKAMPVTQRGLALHVDYCPTRARVWRGKPYANVIDDCACCRYLYAYPADVICGYPVDKETAMAELAPKSSSRNLQ